MSEATTLSSDISRSEFLYSLLIFGAPFAVFLALNIRFLHASHFKPRLISSWIASRGWHFVADSWRAVQAAVKPDASQLAALPAVVEFERVLPFLRLVLLALVTLPLLLLIAWGFVAYNEVNRLFGLSVVLILPASLLAGFGLAHWKYSAWRLTRLSQACFFAASMLVMCFEVFTIFLAEPYTFVGISAVMLAFNMLPMIHLVFYVTQAVEAKPFDSYPFTSFDKPVPEELQLENELTDEAAIRSLSTRMVQPELQDEERERVRAVRAAGKRRQVYILGGTAFVLLMAYGTIVATLSDDAEEEVGFITAGAVIVLDATVFLSVLGGRLRQATRTCITLIACRIALVVFGDVYWFVGHSIMYLLLACFFVYNLFERYLPYQSRKERTQAVYTALGIDELLGVGSAGNDGGEQVGDGAGNADGDDADTGCCSKALARFKVWATAHVDLVALVTLSFFFLIDLALSAGLSETDIQLNESHDQYEAGLLAMFLVLVFSAVQLLLRMYANDEYKPTRRVVLAALAIWAATLAAGGFLFAFTSSVIIITLCAFMPPIVYGSAYNFVEWKTNDYHLFLQPRPPFFPDFFKRGFPRRDYAVAGSLATVVLLVVCMGLTMATHSDPSWVGWTISAGMLVIATSLLPLVEWFNTFEISSVMISNTLIALGVHVSFCAVFFTAQLDRDTDEYTHESIGLLFFFIMYPTLVLLGGALYKWRDDGYKMSNVVRTAFLICGALVVAFCLALAIVFDPWELGATMLVLFALAVGGRILVPKVRARYPRAAKYAGAVAVVLVLIYSLVVGLEEDRGFVGFSMMCGVLFVGLAALAYRDHRRALKASSTFVFSPTLFPVFEYRVAPGLHDPLVLHNARAWLPLGMIAIAFYWGVLATYFVSRTSVGLGVSSIALLVFYLYAVASTRQPLEMLASAVATLHSGSEVYIDALVKARKSAIGSQLTQSKDINSATHSGSVSVSLVDELSGDDSDDGVSLLPVGSEADARDDFFSGDHLFDLEQGYGDFATHPWQELLRVQHEFTAHLPVLEPNWKYVVPKSVRYCTCMNHPDCPGWCPKMAPPPEDDDGDDDASVGHVVLWQGSELVLHQALMTILEAELRVNKAFLAQSKYQAQLTVELSRSANALVVEHEQTIVAMLQAAGKDSVSLAVIRSLDPQSPARRELDHKLRQYLTEQEAIRMEQERRQREDEEAQRRREEAERIRRLEEEAERREEEQREAEERRLQMQEETRRKEEERLRLEREEAEELARRVEEEERRKAEVEAVRLQLEAAQREEQERREALRQRAKEEKRRRQEAIRLAQEEEVRKQLEAEMRAKEVERKRREKERRKREAQRQKELALEARRKEEERLRLAAEQRALQERREQELAKAKQAVKRALDNKVCTLCLTGKNYVPQQFFTCATCGFTDGAGVCLVCAEVCHDGHDLVLQPASRFYCDCGVGGCRAATLTAEEREQEDKRKNTVRSSGDPVAEIIEQCRASGTKFTDHEFSGDAALYENPRHPKNRDWNRFQWRRVSELAARQAHKRVYTEPVDPNDIKQGSIGDCWYMSALSVLTQRQEDLARCFITKELNEWGVYAFRFVKNGEERVVVIDDQLPCHGNNPAFGRSREGQMWVSLIEKAYAKLHKSYEAIEGGFVDQALVDLTGGIATRFDMASDAVKQDIRNGQLFKRLLEFHEAGFLMGAGSPSGSDSEENASRWGIVQGHAYALLDVREVDDHQLLRLRNPWGRKEWTGDWSDGSSRWTRRLKKKLGYVNDDDGSFWMSFMDFSRHFVNIYVCRFFQAPLWKTLEPIRRRWSVAENTAGGCTNHSSVKHNPMYLLDVREPCTVVISLEQEDVRGQGKKLAGIGIEIYANRGRRISKRKCGRLVASNADGYIFRREVVAQVELQPDEHPYTVLLSTFNSGVERKFTLRFMFTKDVGVEKLQ